MILTSWEQVPYPVRKAWRIMRITSILILVISLHLSANTLAQKVTITANDISIEQFFSQLEKQTGYSFLLENGVISKNEKISVSVNDALMETVLDQILKPINLSYRIENKTVYILKASKPLPSGGGSSHLDSLPHLITIHGKITDSLGNPLPGATVAVKGTLKGTETDNNGYFTIKDAKENAVLIISFTGYSSREFKIHGQSEFTIKLNKNTSPLDAVQVIAYGTTTQRLSTGDVTTVTSKEIEQQPVSNPLAALEGRVPGLFIIQNTGIPGGGFQVQIQGKNSLQNGSDPLYVIDGVPYVSELLDNLGESIYQANGNGSAAGNPLSFINPSDIESITVLKDADATAIYGSRAANGAILITTKKGKTGNTKLDINYYSGIGTVPQKVNWLNTSQYLKMRHEAFYNDSLSNPGGYSVPDQYSAPDLVSWDTTSYTNWQKAMIGGSSHYNNAQVSVSGGTANNQYLIGGGYQSETSVFPMDGGDKKASLHVNIVNTSANQKFKIVFTGNYLSDSRTLPSYDLTGWIETPPDAPKPFNLDHSLNWANSSWPGNNPYSFTRFAYKSQVNNLVSNLVLSYNILRGLQLLSSFGYSNIQDNEISTIPIIAQDPAYSPTGSSSFANNGLRSWIVEPQLTYRVNISKSKIEVLLGSTFEQRTSAGRILSASGYTSDLLLEDAQAAPTLNVNLESSSLYKYTAIFGRLNYNYKEKYLLNINWRRDGSSRFGPERQFHNFGSVGAAWIFSSGNIVNELLPILSFGKLHISYGSTGNDQIADYGFYNLFSTTRYSYQGTVGLTPSRLYNPDIAWELTKKLQGGIDFGFFKDRVLVNANYYFNTSSNHLLFYSLPAIAGFSGVQANLPATVQNNGWEFFINTSNLKTNDFHWTSSINLTIPHNKLSSFPNFENSPYKNVFAIGQPISVRKVFHLIGVNDTTGIYQFSDNKGSPTYAPVSGTDNTAYINTDPKFYGGFLNTFYYKKFQLDIFLQFTKQVGSNILFQPGSPPGSFYVSNEPTEILKRWQKPGDKSFIEQFTQDFGSQAAAAYFNAQMSDVAYTDASYVRLKNVSLSYQFSATSLSKILFQNITIYLHAQNLFTITNYKGTDPESRNINALPPLRVITGGIRILF